MDKVSFGIKYCHLGVPGRFLSGCPGWLKQDRIVFSPTTFPFWACLSASTNVHFIVWHLDKLRTLRQHFIPVKKPARYTLAVLFNLGMQNVVTWPVFQQATPRKHRKYSAKRPWDECSFFLAPPFQCSLSTGPCPVSDGTCFMEGALDHSRQDGVKDFFSSSPAHGYSLSRVLQCCLTNGAARELHKKCANKMFHYVTATSARLWFGGPFGSWFSCFRGRKHHAGL